MWANPGPFFVYFQTNITTNKYEKCPYSIWHWDSNPRRLLNESPPITTKQGSRPEIVIYKPIV